MRPHPLIIWIMSTAAVVLERACCQDDRWYVVGLYAERVVIYSWLYNIGTQSPVCAASSLLGSLKDGIIRVFMNPMGMRRKRTIKYLLNCDIFKITKYNSHQHFSFYSSC